MFPLLDENEESFVCQHIICSNLDPSCAEDIQRTPSPVLSLRRIIAVASIAWMGISTYHHFLYPATSISMGTSILAIEQRSQSLQEVEASQDRRMLWGLSNFFDPSSIALRKPFGSSDIHYANSNMATKFRIPDLSPYNQQNIIMTASVFQRELFLLYYDPNEDAFMVYVDERKDNYQSTIWSPIWSRLNLIMPTLAFALRNNFPERFQGSGSAEFITLVSSGEAPIMLCDCVMEEERLKRPNFCPNEMFAPILQFGSVYKDAAILPTAVTMPTWVNLPCFAEWQMTGGGICQQLQLRRDVAGLLGGEEALGGVADDAVEQQAMPFSEWDALIPSLIWRGSDLAFLACLHPGVRSVDWARDVAPRLARFGDTSRGVIQSLLDLWDDSLTPRWKAATLSAMAKLDADEIGTEGDKSEGVGIPFLKKSNIPWIDAKFTVKSTSGHYHPFQEHGMPVTDEEMTLSQLSKYKYHIDIGGGGGTTWLGTVEKLAMPGVLFHHNSATKDFYHDGLLAWIHYIPVSEDLSNLREMYDWAEGNSAKAQKISEAATEYVKNMAKPEVMKASYEMYFVHSLKKVIGVYQPMEGDDAHGQMKKWLSNWSLAGKCSGRDETCELKNWRVST